MIQPFLFKKIIIIKNLVLLLIQHLYVYGVLIFEAMATFIGQVSVLSLIALFGAATTAMVNPSHKLEYSHKFQSFSPVPLR